MRLAHVVLRTNKFEEMKRFYKTFLGGEACFENEAISFMSYDEEHHRIAVVNVPGTADKLVTSCGLEAGDAFAIELLALAALLEMKREERRLTTIFAAHCLHVPFGARSAPRVPSAPPVRYSTRLVCPSWHNGEHLLQRSGWQHA